MLGDSVTRIETPTISALGVSDFPDKGQKWESSEANAKSETQKSQYS